MPVTISGNGTFTGTSLVANNIADYAISTAKLANSAITTAKMGYSGGVLQVVAAGGGSATVTTAYNNASLSPIHQLSITAVSSTSRFLVSYTAMCGQTGPYRSQILLSKNWVSGTAAIDGNYIWYDHYGMYISTSMDSRHPGAFEYLDTGSLTAGTSRTYYVFGGTIGGGTQTFTNQHLTIMEIS